MIKQFELYAVLMSFLMFGCKAGSKSDSYDESANTFPNMKVVFKGSMQVLPGVAPVATQTVKFIDVIAGKMREETTIETEGTRNVVVQIFDGKNHYSFNPDNPSLARRDSMSSSLKPWEFVNSGSDNYKRDEIILGRKCKYFEGSESKAWVWNGLVLKSESTRGGLMSAQEAIEIEGNPIFPETLFILPEKSQVWDQEKKINETLNYANEHKEDIRQKQAQWEQTVADRTSLDDIRLAIAKFYGDHMGVWPGSLGDLVPKYLSSIPGGDWIYDPASGELKSRANPSW